MGVKLSIENPKEVFERLRRGLIFEEEVRLPVPTNFIKIRAEFSSEKKLALSGEIRPIIKKNKFSLREILTGEFHIYEINDGDVIILDSEKRAEFEVSWGSRSLYEDKKFKVITGRDLLDDRWRDEPSKVGALPCSDFEEFQRSLEKFFKIIEVILLKIDPEYFSKERKISFRLEREKVQKGKLGIKLSLENPREIFEEIKRGIILEGEARLPLPANLLRIAAKMDSEKELALSGEIRPIIKKVAFSLKEILAEEFPIQEISDNEIIILDQEKKAKFEVRWGPRSRYSDEEIKFKVTAGKDLFDVLWFTKSSFLPCSNFEEFERNIKEFFKIIGILLFKIDPEYFSEEREVSFRYEPRKSRKWLRMRNRIEVIKKPDVSFSKIGGLEKAKREIQGIIFALKNPGLYKKWGTKPPRGILLYGPPGTGKTLLAKALAAEAEASFFNVSINDITSPWYGESEALMEEVFEIAKEAERSIIFFDELDALARVRAKSHEATERVLAVLLENLDGMKASENIIVVGATNRLEAIDPALTRAGRLDRIIEAPLPDEEGREEIFKIHMKRAEDLAQRKVFGDIDLNLLVSKTNGMSGADIAEILRRTLEEKVRMEGLLREELPQLSKDENSIVDLVTTENILDEIAMYERKESKTI